MKRFGVLLSVCLVLISCSERRSDSPSSPSPLKEEEVRVVSLAPSVTETLFALGAGETVVGVTSSCDYPPEALEKPKIGDFMNLQLEALLQVSPTLAVGVKGAVSQAQRNQLEKTGVVLKLVEDGSVAEVLAGIQSMGKWIGKEKEAEGLVQNMRAQLATAEVAKPRTIRVLLVVSWDPLVVAGPGSFVDDVMAVAGAINVAKHAKTDYPSWDMEAVLSAAPDVIVECLMGKFSEPLSRWARWDSIPAVATKQVYALSPDLLLRPGPRVGEGVDALRAVLLRAESRKGESR